MLEDTRMMMRLNPRKLGRRLKTRGPLCSILISLCKSSPYSGIFSLPSIHLRIAFPLGTGRKELPKKKKKKKTTKDEDLRRQRSISGPGNVGRQL